MSIDAITFLPPLAMPAAPDAAGAAKAPGGEFASWFGAQLADVNSQLVTADQGIQQLAAGDASNLHQIMINLEQAKLSMQLVMQVRNHLLDGYRELMQMQM
ncbi:flagellar hook-basal body complex protein FliE [Massilia atriviolacea]|uniref:Flagellar hook-basal body complex protein FliE n=1 Tax=Massilia atriviolacea TaxID=2495579 RepID=A0A430HFK1_9BURK|nr:flagellar hook-basal body complex protein FliE [Massilia atriviolacea]RSZ56286.1 flagellar hook-basal body complex protein FliE [Massilia atriviolacea]